MTRQSPTEGYIRPDPMPRTSKGLDWPVRQLSHNLKKVQTIYDISGLACNIITSPPFYNGQQISFEPISGVILANLMVARPPFELIRNNFLTIIWLFFAFKSIKQWFSEVLYMIQQIKVFEEDSRLFVSINWARWSEKRVKAELRSPLLWFLEWPLDMCMDFSSI